MPTQQTLLGRVKEHLQLIKPQLTHMQDVHGDEHKHKSRLIVARNKHSHNNTYKGKAVELNEGLKFER